MNYFTILTSFLGICVGTSSDLSRFREKRTAGDNRSDLRGTKHALVSVGVSTDSRGQDRDDHYSYWWAELGNLHPISQNAWEDLGWTEVLWDGPPSNQIPWSQLTTTQEEAALVLEFTQATWNHGLSWEHLTPDIQDDYNNLGWNEDNWETSENVRTMGTPWNDLTDDERDAAVRIGYDSAFWDWEYGWEENEDYDYGSDTPPDGDEGDEQYSEPINEGDYGDEGDKEDGEPINEGNLSMPNEAVTPVEDYTYDGLGEAVTPVEDYTYDGLAELAIA